MMKIICAWCKAEMGERAKSAPLRSPAGNPIPQISHGICAKCKAEQLKGVEVHR